MPESLLGGRAPAAAGLSTMSAQPVLLVQLTDPHLFAEEDGRLLGLVTADSLQQVVELVRKEQPKIDLLLATGDLAQDGSLAAYQRFAQITAPLCVNARWTAGNHDCLQTLQQACAGTDRLEAVTDIGNWRIILLNSSVPNESYGWLSDETLKQLEYALSEAPTQHCLMALHHHPVDVGCAWLASIGLRNADTLFALINRFPQACVLLWGHVHQPFAQKRDRLHLLGSPSCCIQFAAQSADFNVSVEAPGYRWLRLHQDGQIESGISRIDSAICHNIDLSGQGY